MPTLRERILVLVREVPGLTDREIAERLFGRGALQQSVNQAARTLESAGELARMPREDGKKGNYPAGVRRPARVVSTHQPADQDSLSEDDVKRKLQSWLEARGWTAHIVWGKDRGTDIDARRGDSRWLIEVKGQGSRDQMRVNYFLAILGEVLQRMNDQGAHYSIALPDIRQFRSLWDRLPQLARSRTQISALFVSASGKVEEVL